MQDYLKYDDVCSVLQKYILFRNHSHEMKVSEHAERILASVDTVFSFSSMERSMLKYSAYLHDIGYFIDKKGHHKHTRYLILNDPAFNGLPLNLRSMLALISGGHRKSIGKSIKEHTANEQTTILRLASILRLADAIDHVHDADICIDEICLRKKCFMIYLKGKDAIKVSDRIKEKSELFRENFNMEVLVECV
jgi:exopolyphosphatase/guanosine-5'-triphosphate,3'-diphosphate pyrophosphatase